MGWPPGHCFDVRGKSNKKVKKLSWQAPRDRNSHWRVTVDERAMRWPRNDEWSPPPPPSSSSKMSGNRQAEPTERAFKKRKSHLLRMYVQHEKRLYEEGL
jgi:hypothetical protein